MSVTEEDTMFAEAHSTSQLTAVANNYSHVRMSEKDKRRVNEFLILLATCNTVVVSSHSHNLVCLLKYLQYLYICR